ncbi:MAG: YdcF family protein [Bacteroidetes bacterium]|nr:YdcF family protein [Bacteroidota bacterium]
MQKDLSKPIQLIVLAFVALLITTACGSQKYARKEFVKVRKEAPYDVIIVTGLPFGTAQEPGLIFTARMLWSKYLYDHHITKNIIYSGSAVSTPYYEGKLMKIMADSLGIPSDHTFSEIKAEHTTENVYYGMKMAHKMGFKKTGVAADPFQIKMLGKFLKVRCQNMTPIPIIYDSVIPDRRTYQTLLPKIDIRGAAADSTYIQLAERESFSERWRGTRGKHIKFEE